MSARGLHALIGCVILLGLIFFTIGATNGADWWPLK